MILAKIAYDAYNQQFRLTDPQLAGVFKDGEMYLVIVDFLPKDIEKAIDFPDSGEEIDLSALMEPPMPIGHA
jgi:hypothetical protein